MVQCKDFESVKFQHKSILSKGKSCKRVKDLCDDTTFCEKDIRRKQPVCGYEKMEWRWWTKMNTNPNTGKKAKKEKRKEVHASRMTFHACLSCLSGDDVLDDYYASLAEMYWTYNEYDDGYS